MSNHFVQYAQGKTGAALAGIRALVERILSEYSASRNSFISHNKISSAALQYESIFQPVTGTPMKLWD